MAVDLARLDVAPLFAPLTDEQRKSVAAKLEERTVEPGRHLTTEHGSGYFFFVIESGTADVSHDDGAVVATLGPGDFFGEAAIFSTRRRTATVTANDPMVVFAMFGADFALLVDEIPEMKAMVDQALDERLPHAE
jgi:CRP/FNR family cyclic AMP-dependent transcriptional regulator